MGDWKFPNEGNMEKPNGLYYQTMNMTQINERLKTNDIILIPLGSTECHGAGQPTGEDTFLVTRMAEQVALRTGTTMAAPVWYASHPYTHLGMPGTVMVPEDAFLANIRAIIAGFWNTGFRKQIFINGHGDEEVIPLALHQWAKTYQVPVVLISLHWPTVIKDFLKDKAHGGPFDTPFQHACEVEGSYSLALFPEYMDMDLVEDTTPKGYMPPGHVDKGGEVYHMPIKGHEHVGLSGIEVLNYPEGVIGRPTLASADKAMPGVDAFCDYLTKLIGDILERFPPGELPPVDEFTMRDKDEIDALLKGPHNGGKHIYTVAYPP